MAPTNPAPVAKTDTLAEGKIGDIGEYKATLTDKDTLDAKAGVEIEGFRFGIYAGGSLKRLASNIVRTVVKKTQQTWDDKLADQADKLLGITRDANGKII
jgi:hypothetical protein